MKILKTSVPSSAGKVRVVLEMNATDTLLAINPRAFYKLGEPLDDIVDGHMIEAARPVIWDALEQKWIE